MADFFDRQLLVPLLQSTVCAALVVAMLVAIGDYNTPQGGGPVLRSSDDYSIMLNVATSLKLILAGTNHS